MLHRLWLAALLLCVPPLALPKVEAQTAAPELGSMRFEWLREGPADACAPACREWISASGPITADTVKDFKLFAEARDLRGATLVLDSGGGSVLASLELGRLVRQFRMRTSVGRSVPLATPAGEPQRARLQPRGECASMCVFVLLGGIARSVPPEARILVHQIWPGAKRLDASAESYTAEEMVRIQRDVGRIARYTIDMGGDIELFEIAMRIPPWERLKALTPAELRRLRLQTLEATSEPPTSGVSETSEPLPRTHAPARPPERGWTVREAEPHAALVRRHVLTLEGDEIGQFELKLACGTPGGPFRLDYVDSRFLGGAGDKKVRLKDVTLWLGGERMALDLESSGIVPNGKELRSHAVAAVSPDIVAKLSGNPAGVIVVGTRTTDDVRTSIRFGGTGLAKHFPGFAAGCGK